MTSRTASQSQSQQSLACDQILRIANLDAERAYGDLTPFRISLVMEPDGWHVDYELKNPNVNGGGPHYVLSPVTGVILSKRYEQ